MSRRHLAVMTDHIGIWQHAVGSQPDRRFGYCTDDVARSLVVDALHARGPRGVTDEAGIRHSLSFLEDAFGRTSGRFLNFRGADGSWLEDGASEDCHARALAGLATVVAEMPGTEPAESARKLFVLALPAATSFGALRAVSRTLLAIDTAWDAAPGASATAAYELLADHLAEAFDGVVAKPGRPERKAGRLRLRDGVAAEPAIGPSPGATGWFWPEPTLTYENALMPNALIVAGRRLGRLEMLRTGLAVLDWLIDVQTADGGMFSPIGNSQWWPRDGERSRFDQQPIEAATMVAAAAAAYRATGGMRYLDGAEAAYGWFLGDNDLGVAVADPLRGACHDGLTRTGVNANQGAESTLMWLATLEWTRELREQLPGGPRPAAAESGIEWSVRR